MHGGYHPAMPAANVVRPIVLAASCLVIGFVGGWSLANIGGDDISLPAANVDVTVAEPTPKTTSVTAPVAEEVPDRAAVAISVLNGTTRNGFAAATATQLKALGYTTITTGQGPSASGSTTVYYRSGSQPAGERLAEDLQTQAVEPLDGSDLEASAQPGTQLVVLLGT